MRKTFRKRDVRDLSEQLIGLPRFRDTLNGEQAIVAMAGAIDKLLARGNTLDEIAEGIAEIDMMPAATFKRIWAGLRRNAVPAELAKPQVQKGEPVPRSSKKGGKGKAAASPPPAPAPAPAADRAQADATPAASKDQRRGTLAKAEGEAYD